MHDDARDPSTALKFCVGRIKKTAPPEDCPGSEWYSYTIEHDKTRIVGKRSGTLNSVTLYLEDYVEKLNARPSWGYSSYAPKKTKK
jgi:hypothetical protein